MDHAIAVILIMKMWGQGLRLLDMIVWTAVVTMFVLQNTPRPGNLKEAHFLSSGD